MAASHRIMIDAAVRLLQGHDGRILDLGCGNGRLVAAIASRLPGIIPCGVEYVREKASRGRATLERAGGRLYVGDIFSRERPWFDEGPYLLTILMIGRLLEVGVRPRRALINDIKRHANVLLLYTYGDPLSMSAEASGLLGSTFPSAARVDPGIKRDGSLPRLWVYNLRRVRLGGAERGRWT
jgi:SAM-dependent methyltransferase